MDRRKDAQKIGVEELLPNNRRRMQTKDMTMNHILEQLISSTFAIYWYSSGTAEVIQQGKAKKPR